MLAIATMLAGCGVSTGVKGTLVAYDGNDGCHDEDGDPLYFRVAAYKPGAYDGYGTTTGVIDEIQVSCDAGNFKLGLREGRYDIAVLAFQEVIGWGDLEDEEVIRDVRVVDGKLTSVGIVFLDVNDDNERE